MMVLAQIGIMASGGGFDPTYQAVLSRATSLGYTLPSYNQQVKQNAMIVSLKTLGVWNLFDLFYVPCNDGSSSFGSINWVSPSTYQLALSGGTPPTWTSNEGYVGSSNGHIDTGWKPSSNGVNYVQNSASVLVYNFNDLAATNSTLFGWQGATSSGRTILAPENADQTVTWQINQSGLLTASGSNNNSVGLYHLDRSSSSLQELYKDGSLLLSDTAGTSGIANLNAYLLAANNNGSVGARGTGRKLSVFATGASLRTYVSSIDTIISTYMDNL